MTEISAEYRHVVRARHRAATIDRIADKLADGVLAELPDIFLVLIERALNRDLQGVSDMAHHCHLFTPTQF